MKRLFLTLGFIAAVACNQMSLTPVSETESGKIRFLAGGPAVEYNVTTKATVNTSAELITNGFLVNAVKGTAGSDVEVWSNQTFTKVGDTWEQDKWWPNADESYRFFGVYPANYTTTFAAGGPTIAATNANDILCAYKGDAAYKTVNTLAFEHIFARLSTVTVSMVSPYTISDMSIMLTPKTGGTYNLYTGAGQTDGTGWSSTTTGSAVNIASAAFSAGVSTTNNDIYLVPGTYTLSATWTASKDNYTQTFSNITKDVNLVGGKQNNLTVSFTGNGTEIQFGVSVAEWGTESIAAGEWPLENIPKFSVNASGGKVVFAPGNLQYQASTNTWRFAEHQWDYIGGDNANISSSYIGWIDLFGWGTSGVSGYSPIATCYQPWSTSTTESEYNPYGSTSTNLYDGGENAGKADWGYNTIDNNGTPEIGWRTLNKHELEYIINTRTGDNASIIGTLTNVRYTEATIRTDETGVNGLILFPDGGEFEINEFTTVGTLNNGSEWATKCTAEQWRNLEAKGCVFLPASGYAPRINNSYPGSISIAGCYWTSSFDSDTEACSLNFGSYQVIYYGKNGRQAGCSVRLVK